MRSEELTGEVGALIQRLERRIRQHPMYSDLLAQGGVDEDVYHVLTSLEDAIVGLVLLHIRTRREYGK